MTVKDTFTAYCSVCEEETDHRVYTWDDKTKERRGLRSQTRCMECRRRAARGKSKAVFRRNQVRFRLEQASKTLQDVEDVEIPGDWRDPDLYKKGVNGKPPFDEVWRRILEHEGETFLTKTGKEYTYRVEGKGRAITASRNSYKTFVAACEFRYAYPIMPASMPQKLNHVGKPNGKKFYSPSLIWSILMDPRIRQGDW